VDPELDRLARRQHSLLAGWQLEAAGWSPSAVWRAVDAAKLFSIRRGVFRTAGALETQWQAWMAAVLATRCTAVVSHLSTLAAFGFILFPAPGQIDLLRVGPHAQMPGVLGHRTLWLPDHDVTRRNFLPTTTPERAFIDCCGELPSKLLGQAGDDALRRKLLSLPVLVRSFEQIPCSGRRKSSPMRAFLAKRVKGFDPGGSERELDVRRIIERAGYPVPVQQFRIAFEGHTYFVDHVWPESMHGIEFEGFECHGGQWTPFHRDRERLRRLTRAGLTIWPVTSQTTANEILAIAELATRSFR
jgi:hypothetical protein